ncbi:MAG: flagellar hook capping FlgD N-terminal domain-containing protein [Pseudomonadota bacterium]
MQIGGIGTSTAGLKAAGAGAALAENFDDFLKLLTAQMQNQDPLSPMDAKEFTTQLVQFSAVEQAINTNSNLASLIDLQKASQISNAVGFIGMQIEAFGKLNMLTNGTAEFSYGLAGTASSTKISVFNEVGQLVHTTSGATAAGRHTFTWNGLDSNGIAQPDGKYSIVVTAIDANNKPVAVETGIIGTVTGFETTVDGSVLLSLNGIGVPMTDVVSVKPKGSQANGV